MELDRISMALSDMKDIAIRMNEEMKYQEQIIDELVVVSIFSTPLPLLRYLWFIEYGRCIF